MELVSAGRSVESPPGFFSRRLVLENSFRGYTGLFSGNPERSRVEVDLTYDREGSAWHKDAVNMQQSIETTMEGAKVNLMGPERRPGVNSALSTLAYVAHNSCHVVSVDEVWLHRIIGESGRLSGLAELSAVDLGHVIGDPNQQVDFADIKKKYITEAMSIATKKANRPEGVYAVPFRNNWGVLAVAVPRRPVLDSLLDALSSYFLKSLPRRRPRLRNSKQDWTFDLCGGTAARLLYAVLANRSIPRSAGHYRVASAARAVRALLWDRTSSATAATWQDLLDFKCRVWDPVLSSPGVRQLRSLSQQVSEGTATDEDRRTFDALTLCMGSGGIPDFFGFDRGVTESVVSFVLELLLTGSDWDDCFEHDPSPPCVRGTASLLYLLTGRSMLENLTETLLLMSGLLSEQQRREIGLEPVLAGHTHRRFQDGRLTTSTGTADWRRNRLSLFSREWFSTVPVIRDPHTDIRDRIRLRPLLPMRGDVEGRHLRHAVIRSSKADRFVRGLSQHCRGKGVCISGTWYLGALSGGNRDLATDVIRELVSDYHERDRVIAGGCAPVTRDLCRESARDSIDSRGLPYADLVSFVYDNRHKGKVEEDDRYPGNSPTFPFCRTRIREYTSISLELADMVRQVMRLDHGAARCQLRCAVQEVVRSTLGRIKLIYDRRQARLSGQSSGIQGG
jgi:hypothetical protein